MSEQSLESAVSNAVQDQRLDECEKRVNRLEDAMATVLENQAAMTTEVKQLSTILGQGIDFMKKGFIVVVAVIGGLTGIDMTGMM